MVDTELHVVPVGDGVAAVILDETMVELARKRRHRRAVSLSLGDVCDIQQPGANHDTVVDFGIIHHVPQWQQGIAVITRVLRPSGQLLFEEAPRYMLDIWASRTFTVQLGENRCEADESPPNSPVTTFTARIEQRLGGLLFVGAARKTWPTAPPRHRIGEDEPAQPGRSRLRKPLMMFVVIAVVLVAAFGLLDGLVRARIKRRRTGDSGVRVPSTPAQSRARGTLALGKLLPGIAVLAHHRRPPERPALVTRGIYAIARNPIYTAIIVIALGLTLLVPNGIALTGLAMIITGRQPQVRLIAEPYLHHIHGPAYHDYAARVGRFLPGIGRLRVQPQDHR